MQGAICRLQLAINLMPLPCCLQGYPLFLLHCCRSEACDADVVLLQECWVEADVAALCQVDGHACS